MAICSEIGVGERGTRRMQCLRDETDGLSLKADENVLQKMRMTTFDQMEAERTGRETKSH